MNNPNNSVADILHVLIDYIEMYLMEDTTILQKYYTILESNQDKILYIEHAPISPGCYFFYDCNMNLVYIGSSKNLHKRIVQSYKERKNQSDIKFISYLDCQYERLARCVECFLKDKYKPILNIENSYKSKRNMQNYKRIFKKIENCSINIEKLKKYEIQKYNELA